MIKVKDIIKSYGDDESESKVIDCTNKRKNFYVCITLKNTIKLIK